LHTREGFVESVAFSPDSKTLAAGCGDGVVLWDAATRQRLAQDPLPVEGFVKSVAFSPDGKTLAAGYRDGYAGGRSSVVLWDVDLESWQRRAGQIANRNFTRDEWRQYFPDMPYRATFPDLPVPPEMTSK
jgi:WD40 repeat protein